MSCHGLKAHKLARDLSGDTWTILVGEDSKRQTFQMHQELLRKCTTWFDKKILFDTIAAERKLIFLYDEDPDAFGMLKKWAYSGEVTKPKTEYIVKKMPTQAEKQVLEDALRKEFNAALMGLVALYTLAEKFGIKDLCSKAIDALQDGYLQYGTVFGPGLTHAIFARTKKNSKLRESCVGGTLLHISRSFIMFGRREREGWDNMKCREGFSMMNGSKLCPCNFHVHEAGQAHRHHDKYAIKFNDCNHPGADDDDLLKTMKQMMIAKG